MGNSRFKRRLGIDPFKAYAWKEQWDFKSTPRSSPPLIESFTRYVFGYAKMSSYVRSRKGLNVDYANIEEFQMPGTLYTRFLKLAAFGHIARETEGFFTEDFFAFDKLLNEIKEDGVTRVIDYRLPIHTFWRVPKGPEKREYSGHKYTVSRIPYARAVNLAVSQRPELTDRLVHPPARTTL